MPPFNRSTGADASPFQSTRRWFLSSIGATAGLGALTGQTAAQSVPVPQQAGAVYYVVRDNESPPNGRGRGGNGSGNGRGPRPTGEYLVIAGDSGEVVFGTDEAANVAFQYALDEVPERGGTVVASADTFKFSAPAVVGANTTLTGQQGTRLVASQTGTRDDPVPSDAQTNPLPTGHDLVQVRGDNAAVTNITFDGAGTQLDNQAVQADGVRGVTIANNRTVNGFQMALSVTQCTDAVVVGNEVVNPNWYGITSRSAPAGGASDLRQSSDVVIASNRVSGMKFNNIAPYNVSNFLVARNVVFDGGHSLIACSPAQRGTIVGNVCRDLNIFAPDPGGEAGIEIEYKETHLREAVKGTPAARSFDVTITGNQVDNCPVGILARTVPAESGDTAARESKRPFSFTVTGNTVSTASDAGIRIRSGDAGVLATNTLRDNATDIDIADGFTENVETGLNVTRN